MKRWAWQHVDTMNKAGLAQLVEHLICNQGVGGSNPSAGTKHVQAEDMGDNLVPNGLSMVCKAL